MSESVYKVIEIIGTSKDSWENAARVAVERASKTLRDLRVAEVIHEELLLEFVTPLDAQCVRHDDDDAATGIVNEVLAHDHPGLDRLSESDLVGEQVALDRIRKDTRNDSKLVAMEMDRGG